MDERRAGPGLAVRSLVVVALALVSALVLVSPLPLDEPVAWGGDTLEHAVLVDSANWAGEPGFSEETGAPWGVDWGEAPSGGERLHIAAIAILAGATGNIWTGINLHMLLAVAATALAAFLVIRWMGVTDLLAGAAGIVFSLGSAVFDHIEQGHLFLFALYPVPLAVYLAVRWTGWKPPGADANGPAGLRRELWLGAGCVLLIGLSSTYYSLFAVLTVVLLAVLVAIRNLDWRRAVPGMVCAASITAVVALSSLPSLLSDAPRLERRLSDSIRFALDPIRVFLPQSENLTGLTGWGSSPADAVGLAATFGVLWLGWVLLRHSVAGSAGVGEEPAGGGGPIEGLMLRLGAVVGISLAVGVAGGIGWLVARAGGQELRAWSRVSVFITFAGLAALAVLAGRALSARPAGKRDGARIEPVGRYVLLGTVAIALFALLEQRSMLPERSVVRERHADAVAVVEQLEETYPAGSDVLVLPAGSYLNDFGPGQVLALPLLGDALHYSSGSFRGGSGDWQLSWALEPVSSQLEAAASGGFSAVVLQVDHHRLEDPDGVVSAVEEVLGEPAGSVGSWSWWDLAPMRRSLAERDGSGSVVSASALRPLGISVEGTPGFPSTSSERDALVGSRSAIRVRDHADGDEPVVLSFVIEAASGAEVRLAWEGTEEGRTTRVLEPSAEGTSVALELALSGGEGAVDITVEGDSYRRGGDDPDAYAELREIQVFDASLADAPFAVPAPLR